MSRAVRKGPLDSREDMRRFAVARPKPGVREKRARRSSDGIVLRCRPGFERRAGEDGED